MTVIAAWTRIHRADEHYSTRIRDRSRCTGDSHLSVLKWLTEYLKGKTQYGAFSMSALGEEPVTYFTERAVITFFEGTWKRRKNETTREFLGRIVISDMGHALRKWKKKGEARLCSMDEEGMLRIVEEATQEWEENLLQKEIIRKIGYEIAKEKVKDDPELTKYVNTMEDHNNYLEIVKTMFLRDIFTFLWTLLFIIPGIVKAYEYRMIPYLLADDPTMTKDRAFAESRAMMRGNKWRAFVLDLSFLGWHILSVFTLGILELFYVAPYEFMADAALYESLRYGTPAAEQVAYSNAAQIPVPPFAEDAGFAPESPTA